MAFRINVPEHLAVIFVGWYQPTFVSLNNFLVRPCTVTEDAVRLVESTKDRFWKIESRNGG